MGHTLQLLLALGSFASIQAAFPDCDAQKINADGAYGDMVQFNGTAEDGTTVFVFYPEQTDKGPYPVMVYSHGVTGEWAMYEYAFKRYVSHGFVVVFPLIKGPKKDTSSFTTDPMGGFTIKGVHFATTANKNTTSPLYGLLDLENLVLAGHSMGASSTIMAAKKLPAGIAKAAISQHPGICGPFGPPPCLGPVCSTWMPSDFEEASSKLPILVTTSTNDGAFWPAPYTAEHELGCFHKSTDESASKDATAIAQFSKAACTDDGKGGRYDRKWSDGGHDCPMNHESVETQWVLATAKLYAHVGGSASSKCYEMIWGHGADSLQKASTVEKHVVNPPKALDQIVVV